MYFVTCTKDTLKLWCYVYMYFVTCTKDTLTLWCYVYMYFVTCINDTFIKTMITNYTLKVLKLHHLIYVDFMFLRHSGYFV